MLDASVSKVYEPHPAALLLPPMAEHEFSELKRDIEKNGQREPIDLFDGMIVDGLNRFRACQALGITPVYREIEECDDPVAYVLSKNLVRRHLTISQRAMVAAAAESLFAEAAKGRQRQHGGTAPGQPRQNTLCNVAESDSRPIHAAVEAAKLTDVSPRSVAKAKIVGQSPAVAQSVKAGTLSLSKAYDLVKDRPGPTSATAPNGGAECPRGGTHQWGDDDCELCHEPRPVAGWPQFVSVEAVESVRQSLEALAQQLDAAANVHGFKGHASKLAKAARDFQEVVSRANTILVRALKPREGAD